MRADLKPGGRSENMDQEIGIGNWLLRPGLGQLIPWPADQALPDLKLEHSDQVQHLPPRLVQLLCLLTSQPGQLWRREELVEALWPGRLVNEEALSRAISQLRQALGDRSGQPQYIATIPKQGYRLVAALRPFPAGEPAEMGTHAEVFATEGATEGLIHELEAARDTTANRAQDQTLTPPPTRPSSLPRRLGLVLSLCTVLVLVLIARSWFSAQTPDQAVTHSASNPAEDTNPSQQAVAQYRQALLAAQRITAHPGVEHFVEASPDGAHLAYVAVRDDTYRAFVVSTTNSDQWWLVPFSHDDGQERLQISPVFSPDGQQLALAEVSNDGCELVILPLQARTEIPRHPGDWRQLGPCQAQGLLPILDWSGDGRYLAFTDRSEDQPGTAIWQIDLGNGQRQQLTRPIDPYLSDARPRYSPDQRWLSFSRGSHAYRELHLLPLGTSHGERQLSFDHQFSQSHAWLNDSSALVFDSDRSGERALWMLPISAEGHPGPVQALGARGAQYPSIARSARALAFQVAEYAANLWPVADQQLGQQALIQSTKYDNNPAFSPDGQWLAFVSNRSGRGALWLARADGSEQRKLFEPEDGRAAWPVWSPDGRALIFIHYQSSGQWLSRLDLAALTVTRLPLAHQAFSPMFSSDGECLCYSALLPGDGTQIWRLASAALDQLNAPPSVLDQSMTDPSTTAAETTLAGSAISPLGANRGCLGEDGRLYYSRHGTAGIFAISLGQEEQAAEMIIAGQRANQWQSWLLHAGWIAYLGDYAAQTGIWRYHYTEPGSAHETLAQFLPSALPPNLAIAPGSGQMIVAMTDRAEADLFYAPIKQPE